MDGDSKVRDQAARMDRAARPSFDLVASKLRCPLVRSRTVRRSPLLERLAGDDSRRIVSVVAPAGYGKTTLLSQWAGRNGRAVAWVSVDERDNDPKVLLTYVAEALDAVEPISERVFSALASPVSSVPGSVVPRLGSAFSSMTVPVALVLDDVHLVHNSECRAALSVLADHVPDGSRLVFAGRDDPPLRVARLRAEGRILELGPGDLSLTCAEASLLLRDAEVALGVEDVAELHRRTEGWPVGLYLAALCLREGGSLPRAAVSFGGDDRLVSEYVESEFLARISRQERVFLTRTAVLERMSGSLCETVLDMPGSATMLRDLARSNSLLVPLDRQGEWYRYHHLFRDVLQAEMRRLEPGLIPVLRRRAADWCLRNDLPEEALEYSFKAEDVDNAARLAERLWVSADRQGRVTTLQRWYRWLDDRRGIEGHPVLAMGAAILCGMIGRPADAERWADVVDGWQYQDTAQPNNPQAEAWAAVLRATMCRRGVEHMRADADEAVREFAAENFVAPVALLMQGVALVLCGDLDGGDASLEKAVGFGEDVGNNEIVADALCERSLVAMARNQWDRAEAFAEQAGAVLRQAGIGDIYATPLVCATLARTALHRGDVLAARQELVSAQRLRSLLTYAIPHIAVQALIQLTHVHLGLADLAGARTLMQEIDELLKRRPDLGTLVSEVSALRSRLSRERGSSIPGASALTAAELRLLPMLSTHLSFPEIAAELFLSPHTIKTQMKSIYRKLGASTRNQAVTRAREVGLLEG